MAEFEGEEEAAGLTDRAAPRRDRCVCSLGATASSTFTDTDAGNGRFSRRPSRKVQRHRRGATRSYDGGHRERIAKAGLREAAEKIRRPEGLSRSSTKERIHCAGWHGRCKISATYQRQRFSRLRQHIRRRQRQARGHYAYRTSTLPITCSAEASPQGYPGRKKRCFVTKTTSIFKP